MTKEQMLASAFVELADSLVDDFDVVDLMTRLAARCVDVLDVSQAGILLASPAGELRLLAASSDAVHLLELFQLQAEEGPCFDCFRSGAPVVNHELRDGDDRWPRFVAEALMCGFRSVHSLPLRLRGTIVGALNLFNVEAGEMRPGDLALAQAMADVASIAILQHRAALDARLLNDQLNEALTSRIIIEQAKGMVAERHGLDMDAAFETLRSHARRNNLRLSEVARSAVDGSVVLDALRPPPSPADPD